MSSREATSPEDKRLLIGKLIRRQHGVQSIQKRKEQGRARSSLQQRRLFFLDKLHDGNAPYIETLAFEIFSAIDATLLRRALVEIVARHEVLRTTFEAHADDVWQVIHRQVEIELLCADFSGDSSQQQSRNVEKWISAEAAAGFDLEKGPLFRVGLLRNSPAKYVLAFVVHHIIGDNWSIPILFRELQQIYAAFSEGRAPELPALGVQYADYSEWQRGRLSDGRQDGKVEYWRSRLAGCVSELSLPSDFPRPLNPAFRGGEIEFVLGMELVHIIRGLCERYHATPFMVILTGIFCWLYRFSGQADVTIGSPVANRTDKNLEGLIGFFANTLVLRLQIRPGWTFADALEEVRSLTLGAYDNQDIPFERLAEEFDPVRDNSRNPLFQLLFNFGNVGSKTASQSASPVKPKRVSSGRSKFDLAFYMVESGEHILGTFEYCSDLFEDATAQAMLCSFETALDRFASHPDARLDEIPMANAGQERQIAEWVSSACHYEGDHILHHYIETWAQRTPLRTACRFEGEELSYVELDRLANRIAHALIAEGVGPDGIVAVISDRSFDLVPVLLGILKAGAAYLPIDAAYPAERIAAIVADAKPGLLLVQDELPVDVTNCRSVSIGRMIDGSRLETRVKIDLNPDNLAYVIYTSGSTGAPKGAMISHRAICNRLHWMQQLFPLNETDRVLQKTAYTFDVSVWEFFWPLMYGAGLVLARPGGQRDPAYLLEVARAEAITVMHFVPAMLGPFLWDVADVSGLRLRAIFCSGEALSTDLASRFRARFPTVPLFNLYGPTEAAVDVTAWLYDDSLSRSRLPIGRPISNVPVFVLDKYLNFCPPGALGDIYIGGVALARGYVGKAAMTAERFIPSPFAAGERLYRTGDIGRYLPDGNIDFIGRNDFQVKVRGFRIELGEIEARLAEYPELREAVLLAPEGSAGDRYLVAYYVMSPGSEDPGPEVLRRYLSMRLPEYMVPAAYVHLHSFPLTTSGKLDRKMLPKPDSEAYRRTPYEAPVGGTEVKLAQIWTEILGVEEIGRHDDFFELGGDSIRSLRVVSRAKQESIAISVSDIFRQLTIQKLAQCAESVHGASPLGGIAEVESGVVREDEFVWPLSPLARDMLAQMHFLNRRDINLVQAVTPTPLLFDVASLSAAFSKLVARYPVLRVSFSAEHGTLTQQVHAGGNVSVSGADWRGIPEAEQKDFARQYLADDARQGLDLSRSGQWRVFVAQIADKQAVLFNSYNYMSMDGWTIGLLGRELQQILRGEEVETDRVDYGNYLKWIGQKSKEDGEHFWRQELSGRPSALVSSPGSNVPVLGPEFDVRGTCISSELTARLRKLSREAKFSEYLIHLAAWALLVSGITGSNDIVLGIVVTGRTPEFPGIEGMVGTTMNYLPMRIQIVPGETHREFLTRLRLKQIQLMDFEETSLQEVRRWCGLGDGDYIFDSLFYFQNHGGYFRDGFSQTIDFRVPCSFARTAYPLRFDVFPTVEEIGNQVYFSYFKSCFADEVVEGYVHRYTIALRHLCDLGGRVGATQASIFGGAELKSDDVTGIRSALESLW